MGMAGRRTPPKRRHRERTSSTRSQAAEQSNGSDDPNGYSAPSHMGGSFDDAGYSSGLGGFGFQHHTTQPTDVLGHRPT